MTNRNLYDHRPAPAYLRALQSWTGHSAPEVAAALAWAGEEAQDWRIACLTWLYANDDSDIERIALRLALVVEAAAELLDIRVDAPIVAAAVWDAMQLVRRGRDRRPKAASARALEFRMSKQSFVALRKRAELSLLRALAWGLERYMTICGYAVQSKENIHDGEVDQSLARAA
jgi:hypothetical protein